MSNYDAVYSRNLSRVHQSNLITKRACVAHDARQRVLDRPGVPDAATRRLLARLVLEEALETVHALGFTVHVEGHDESREVTMEATADGSYSGWHEKDGTPNLVDVVDGCCDLIYVATGALAACGVPDLPHLHIVCEANEAKFPGGVALINPATGKYQKPLGWTPPDHAALWKGVE